MKILRGDIVYVKLNGQGSVQNGVRPFVILQNDIGNQFSTTTIGVPLTSRTKNKLPTHITISPTEENGLNVKSTALAEQIMTVDKKEIVSKLGHISSNDMKLIENAIIVSLGFMNIHTEQLCYA